MSPKVHSIKRWKTKKKKKNRRRRRRKEKNLDDPTKLETWRSNLKREYFYKMKV